MTHHEFMWRYLKDEEGARAYIINAANDKQTPLSELLQACVDVSVFLARLDNSNRIKSNEDKK